MKKLKMEIKPEKKKGRKGWRLREKIVNVKEKVKKKKGMKGKEKRMKKGGNRQEEKMKKKLIKKIKKVAFIIIEKNNRCYFVFGKCLNEIKGTEKGK